MRSSKRVPFTCQMGLFPHVLAMTPSLCLCGISDSGTGRFHNVIRKRVRPLHAQPVLIDDGIDGAPWGESEGIHKSSNQAVMCIPSYAYESLRIPVFDVSIRY